MIVLYHGIVADRLPRERWCNGQALPLEDVKRQLEWLARRFRIVPMAEYLAGAPKKPGRQMAAITFDDGMRATFENVSPVLQREGLPATLFVSTVHLGGGELLWFSYLNALCFEGHYQELTVEGRQFRLATLEEKKRARNEIGAMAKQFHSATAFVALMKAAYPLPPETLLEYAGMTHDQLVAAGESDLVEIASHTVTHPFLTRESPAEQTREIYESKRVLAASTGRPVRYFAYPSGDYDGAVLARVRDSGYEAAFATRPRGEGAGPFAIGRVGIYSPSMLKFKLKAAGFVELAESVGMRVG